MAFSQERQLLYGKIQMLEMQNAQLLGMMSHTVRVVKKPGRISQPQGPPSNHMKVPQQSQQRRGPSPRKMGQDIAKGAKKIGQNVGKAMGFQSKSPYQKAKEDLEKQGMTEANLRAQGYVIGEDGQMKRIQVQGDGMNAAQQNTYNKLIANGYTPEQIAANVHIDANGKSYAK